jgi:nitronate monooxygenase
MGTRFCATAEAPIHRAFKLAIVANDERSTDVIFRSYGNSARVARNAISQRVIALEREGRPFDDVAPLVKGTRGLEGLVAGDLDHGIWTAGQVQGLVHDIPTVDELVSRIVSEAQAIIRDRLASLMS